MSRLAREDDYYLIISHGVTEAKCTRNITTKSGGLRNTISGFSQKSRNRLLKLLHSLDTPPESFITLTYPAQYSADPQCWKNDLDRFAKRARRQFPNCWFVWKLEPQKRGAPHFHLIGSFGLKDYGKIAISRWIRKAWTSSVNTTSRTRAKHNQHGTHIKRADSKYKLSCYLSKYIGKVLEYKNLPEWARPGRFWGYINKEMLPPLRKVNVRLSRSAYYRFRRITSNLLKSYKRTAKYGRFIKKVGSFFILKSEETITKILQYLIDTSPDSEFAEIQAMYKKNKTGMEQKMGIRYRWKIIEQRYGVLQESF